MFERMRFALLLCAALLLEGCGYHWRQATSPGNKLLPGPPPPITRHLGGADLRLALRECVEKSDPDRLSDMRVLDDDKLRSWVPRTSLPFNQCMSMKGWMAFPDTIWFP